MDNQINDDLFSSSQLGSGVKEYRIDPIKERQFETRLQEEQNLLAGILAGGVAVIAGAILWAAFTLVTEFQIGWMAIAIGFIVGFAIRRFGRGVDKVFGIMGATLSVLSCVGGNLLFSGIVISQHEAVSAFAVLLGMLLHPVAVMEILVLTFSPIDLLFYGLAIYEGYKLSFRRITQAELDGLLSEVVRHY
jgi:hypothetical protein